MFKKNINLKKYLDGHNKHSTLYFVETFILPYIKKIGLKYMSLR